MLVCKKISYYMLLLFRFILCNSSTNLIGHLKDIWFLHKGLQKLTQSTYFRSSQEQRATIVTLLCICLMGFNGFCDQSPYNETEDDKSVDRPGIEHRPNST